MACHCYTVSNEFSELVDGRILSEFGTISYLQPLNVRKSSEYEKYLSMKLNEFSF